MPIVRVRYFAGARAAAGVEEDQVELPAPARVADVLAELRRRRGERLSAVLAACSYLLDGVAVHDEAATVPTVTAELDVLPPFAGG